jgi:hypothetical protein
MQKLLIPRPALLLVPRARARAPFVRHTAISCSHSRRLVTVVGLQSWFAGSPRKEVRVCAGVLCCERLLLALTPISKPRPWLL